MKTESFESLGGFFIKELQPLLSGYSKEQGFSFKITTAQFDLRPVLGYDAVSDPVVASKALNGALISLPQFSSRELSREIQIGRRNFGNQEKDLKKVQIVDKMLGVEVFDQKPHFQEAQDLAWVFYLSAFTRAIS